MVIAEPTTFNLSDQFFYGDYALSLQTDGNFVVSTREGDVVAGFSDFMEPSQYTRIHQVRFQSDGNFAAYDRNMAPVWSALEGTYFVTRVETNETKNTSNGPSGYVQLSRELDFTTSYPGNKYDSVWLKVGYKMGKHAFAIDFSAEGEPESQATIEAETMDISYVFAPAKGVELFAGYREYVPDDIKDAATLADAELNIVGGRVRF